MLINISDDFRWHVEEVRGDPEHAVTGRTSRATLTTASLRVRLAFHLDPPHFMGRASSGLAVYANVHDAVAENSRRCSLRRNRSLLCDQAEVTVIADATDVAAIGGNDVVPKRE